MIRPISRTLRPAGSAIALLALTACEGAFTSRVDVAATAAGAELPVELLADMMAESPQLALRREVAEGVALLWVDFTLFANRVVAGDSLLDSTTVLAATWPEVQQTIASAYHARLFGDSVELDSAQVDSVYAAGDYRYLSNVSFLAGDSVTPMLIQAKRAQAEYVLGQLRRREITWAEATTVTDEPGGRERNGVLGVVARGQLREALDTTAFGLASGEVSNVVPTELGFHILHRPALDDVRDEFRAGVRERLQEDADSLYLEALEEKWDIEVRSGALPAVRQIVLDPLRAKQSGKVIGSHRHGEFRIRDLARWFQGMDSRVWGGVVQGSDEQIERMIRTLIRNEVLLREARNADVELTDADFAALQDHLRRRLALVRAHMQLGDDSIVAFQDLPAPARRERVQLRVTSHLQWLAREPRQVRAVPPFLADHLREQVSWDIVPAGIERALERARALRTRLEAERGGPSPQRPAPTEPVAPETPPADSEGT